MINVHYDRHITCHSDQGTRHPDQGTRHPGLDPGSILFLFPSIKNRFRVKPGMTIACAGMTFGNT